MMGITNYYFGTSSTRQIDDNKKKEYSLQNEVSTLALRFFKYMCKHPGALITTTLACIARSIESAPFDRIGRNMGLNPDDGGGFGGNMGLNPDDGGGFGNMGLNPDEGGPHIMYNFDSQRLCALVSQNEEEFTRNVLHLNCDHPLSRSIRIPSHRLKPAAKLAYKSNDPPPCKLLSRESPEFVRDVLKLDCDQFVHSQNKTSAPQSRAEIIVPTNSTATNIDENFHVRSGAENLTVCTLLPEDKKEWARANLQLHCDQEEYNLLWRKICPTPDSAVDDLEYFKKCMKEVCALPKIVLLPFRDIIGNWCETKTAKDFLKIFISLKDYLQLRAIKHKIDLEMEKLNVTRLIIDGKFEPEKKGISLETSLTLSAAGIGVGASIITLVSNYIGLKVATQTHVTLQNVGAALPTNLRNGMELIAQNTVNAARSILTRDENIPESSKSSEASSFYSLLSSLFEDVKPMGSSSVGGFNIYSAQVEWRGTDAQLGESKEGVVTRLLEESTTNPNKILLCIFHYEKRCAHINPNKMEVSSKDWRDVFCVPFNNDQWCRLDTNRDSSMASSTNPNVIITNLRSTGANDLSDFCRLIRQDLWCNISKLTKKTMIDINKLFGNTDIPIDLPQDSIVNIEAIILERNQAAGENNDWEVNVFLR